MRTFRLLVPILLASAGAVACGPGAAPQPDAPVPTSEPAPTPAPEPLSFGRHHHPVRTANPEAQRLFDQGMAQAFGFNHEAAIRSFERAAELDPAAAMPLWGKAWALGPNYNLDIDEARAKEAYETVTKAKSLVVGDVERAYVDALATRYSADLKADRAALARSFSRAMGELSRRYRDDLDAAVIYAESLMNLTPWKLWTPDGRPAANTNTIVSVLESVLLRDPIHLGANHYYIHAVEASRTPARALASAHRLAEISESSGHLLHMPAHIFARTGDHAGAAAANAAGAEADRKYIASAPPNGLYRMMYYPHNLHFLADSHMMQGRFEDARQAAARAAELLEPHAAMMPMVESMLIMPTSVLLRFGRYDDILAAKPPAADRKVQRAWHHFARGTALARTGKAAEAAAERKLLAAAIAEVPEEAAFGGGGWAGARTVLNIAALALDARIASAQADHGRAIKLWQQAVAAADQLPYDEPPVWFYPIRESLGAELLCCRPRLGRGARVPGGSREAPAQPAIAFRSARRARPAEARCGCGVGAAGFQPGVEERGHETVAGRVLVQPQRSRVKLIVTVVSAERGRFSDAKNL